MGSDGNISTNTRRAHLLYRQAEKNKFFTMHLSNQKTQEAQAEGIYEHTFLQSRHITRPQS